MTKTFIRTAVTAAAAFALVAFSGNAQAEQTLCSGAEKVIFSCSTGKKMVSVCQTDASGSVQYRFGKYGKTPDIVLPENPASKEGVLRGMNSFSGGGGAYITFIKGDTSYIVHNYMGKRGDDIGIDVIRPNKNPISIQCVGMPDGDLENDTPKSIPLDPQSNLQ